MHALRTTGSACTPSYSRERTDIMATVNVRRPSPLQRQVLIVLAALGAKRSGPVATGISSACWRRAGRHRCTGRTCVPPAGAWRRRAGCTPCGRRTRAADERGAGRRRGASCLLYGSPAAVPGGTVRLCNDAPGG